MSVKRILFLLIAFTASWQSVGSEVQYCKIDRLKSLVLKDGKINLDNIELLNYLRSTDYCNVKFVVNIKFAYANNNWILSPMKLVFIDRRPDSLQISAIISQADAILGNGTVFVINLR